MGVAALWLFTAAAGAACAGLIRVPLRIEERSALAIVTGVVGGSLITLLIGLAAGLTALTALLGPAILIGVAALAAALLPGPSPLAVWSETWRDARGRLWERDTWIMGLLTVFAAVAFWRLFAHTFFSDGQGGIKAGFATVWADWSLHSTLASSFSVAGNLPPHDPIFSGGSLRYPFLADFHAATHEAVGGSVAVALAVPCAVLCTATTLLVVSLGRRLSGSLAVGILAMLLCLAGGSLGWRTMWWDACTVSGHAQTDCSPSSALTSPGTALDVLRSVPSTAGTQTRNYDNLQNSAENQISDGNNSAVQWYTPLLAWWLPQRTFVYGFAIGVAVLLLAVAGMRAPPGTSRSPFLAAGLLAGTLPLIHIHTLIALAIVLTIWALMQRRREWLWLGTATVVLAVPRLLQVAASGNGAANPDCPAQGTRFPYFQVGWLSQTGPPADACSPPGWSEFSFSGAVSALGRLVRLPANGDFWGFWLDNNGVVLIVPLVLGLAALVGLLPRFVGWLRGDDREPTGPPPGVAERIAGVAAAVTRPIPAELLRFCLPFLAIFLVANVVVFQTWNWDNTKLLAWWYLGGALLTAAWIAAWWRRGGWRALTASFALLTLVLSAGLTLTRIVQQEAAHSGGGPYQWASAADVALAADVRAKTDQHAVFVIPRTDPTNPVQTLAGRSALLGYEGWLYSYGVDTQMRPTDRDTVYNGCPAATGADAAACPIPGILRQNGIDYVVMPANAAAQPWFAAAYPVIASSSFGTAVYDVRATR